MVFDGWLANRRILDLDSLARDPDSIQTRISQTFEVFDDGTANAPITELIRCVLVQALVDRAIAIHIFYDDEDDALRMQYCLISPENSQRTWYEMVPPPVEIRTRFFERLRWHAGMRKSGTTGVFRIRSDGDLRTLAIVQRWPEDFRVYLTDERPPIRPKLARHREEMVTHNSGQ